MALVDCGTLEDVVIRALRGELGKIVAYHHELKDPHAARNRLVTSGAADLVMEGGVRIDDDVRLGEMRVAELGLRGCVDLGAVDTEPAKQALREDGAHGPSP